MTTPAVTNSVENSGAAAQTRAQAERYAAIQFMQQMLAFGEGAEHYRLAINALRRSGDHSAIQQKCNALQEERDDCNRNLTAALQREATLADKLIAVTRQYELASERADVVGKMLLEEPDDALDYARAIGMAEKFKRERGEFAAQLAEAERDARRYRWLRDVATTGDWCELGGMPAASMEAAIDAALERT